MREELAAFTKADDGQTTGWRLLTSLRCSTKAFSDGTFRRHNTHGQNFPTQSRTTTWTTVRPPVC